MPQTTLLGFFTPVQVPCASKQIAYDQASKPLIQAARAASDKALLSEKTLAAKDLGVFAAVQAAIQPSGFGLSSDDFFVPTSQPQAAIVKALPSHTARLKTITSTLLPVRYPDKFFNECLEDEIVSDFTRVLLWNSQPVGWIRCRLEDNEQGHKQIYVQALGILAPYRGCGLATALLEQVTQPSLIQRYHPISAYCHVWESNDEALEWYEKRGFKRVILMQQYYRRLKPAGAWIMRKELT